MVRDLKHRYVDGLILASLHLTDAHADELRRAAAPVIVIGRPTKGTPSDSVRAYSRKGAAEAVRHLHAAGRRRIAFVNGPPHTAPGPSRRLGYLDGLRSCGLARNDALMRGRRRLHDRAGPQRDRAPARAGEARRDLLRERPARDRRALGAARRRARRARRRRAGRDGQHDAGGGHLADADLGRPRLGRAGADRGRAAARADRGPVGASRACSASSRASSSAPRRERRHDRRPRGRSAGAGWPQPRRRRPLQPGDDAAADPGAAADPDPQRHPARARDLPRLHRRAGRFRDHDELHRARQLPRTARGRALRQVVQDRPDLVGSRHGDRLLLRVRPRSPLEPGPEGPLAGSLARPRSLGDAGGRRRDHVEALLPAAGGDPERDPPPHATSPATPPTGSRASPGPCPP